MQYQIFHQLFRVFLNSYCSNQKPFLNRNFSDCNGLHCYYFGAFAMSLAAGLTSFGCFLVTAGQEGEKL